MLAAFIISLLPLIRVFVELSQTNENPDIRGHLIFQKTILDKSDTIYQK
jgi:hypothetical protein